ncbi:unnamed protein product [Dicrocoelium dendriticum]|nr:unnamed protein product [Dicrocoelium dendriticum]
MAMRAIFLLTVFLLLSQKEIKARSPQTKCNGIAASYNANYGRHCGNPRSSSCVNYLQAMTPVFKACRLLG